MKALKITLLANASFSLSSGLTLILFDRQVSTWMSISNPTILLIIGIALIVFELLVTFTAFSKPIKPKFVKLIIFLDWLWVAGSITIIAIQAFELNIYGYWMIGVVATIVAVFALLQTKYLGNN